MNKSRPEAALAFQALFAHKSMTFDDDKPSVITETQLARLISSMTNSFAVDHIERALSTAFGPKRGSLTFLEKNAIHHGILDIVRNASSPDEIGKQIAEVIQDTIDSKIELFREVLYGGGEVDGNKSLSIGKIRRHEG